VVRWAIELLSGSPEQRAEPTGSTRCPTGMRDEWFASCGIPLDLLSPAGSYQLAEHTRDSTAIVPRPSPKALWRRRREHLATILDLYPRRGAIHLAPGPVFDVT
jgi:hypothetical protein